VTRRQKRIIACIVFIPAIAGALVPSYLHLADWYPTWMPAGWKVLSYVAALVTEAPVIACGVSLVLLPSGLRNRWPVYLLLVYSVGVSMYVNARWAWHENPAPTETGAWWAHVFDVALGSAALPLFALACGLVLDWVLRSVSDDPVKPKASERKPAPVVPQAAAPAMVAPVASGGLAERWRAAVARHGGDKTVTELAQLEGVSRQAVSQWRKAATAE
jgi:hypothetical protein